MSEMAEKKVLKLTDEEMDKVSGGKAMVVPIIKLNRLRL